METERHIPIHKTRRFCALESAKSGDFSGITDDFEKLALSEIMMNEGVDKIRDLADTQQEIIVREPRRKMGGFAIYQNGDKISK